MHATTGMPAGQTPSQTDARIDFKVSRIRERDWEIVALSKQGMIWAKANFAVEAFAAGEPALHTSLTGANDFLRKARANGYRTQYAGPSLTTIF